MLCPVQQLFGLGAVAGHVVVTGRACPLHLMNHFDAVVVNGVQVVPVVDPIGYRHRATGKQNPKHKSFSWRILSSA